MHKNDNDAPRRHHQCVSTLTNCQLAVQVESYSTSVTNHDRYYHKGSAELSPQPFLSLRIDYLKTHQQIHN